MFESSCLCGANRLHWEAEPILRMRCWCVDCRKFSGSTNTNNVLMPLAGMRILKGNLKTFTLDVESGNQMTSFFCSDCGSTIYRKSSGFKNGVAVMVGCVDGLEVLFASKPQVEIYTSNRPEWVAPIQEADQEEGRWHPKPDHIPKEFIQT